MKQFRMDNTDGYTEKQLAIMNEEYENEIVIEDENDINYENECKHIADRVLRDMDYIIAYKKCMSEYEKNSENIVECQFCGTAIESTRQTKTNDGHHFCSYECFSSFFCDEIPEEEDFLSAL